MTPDRSGTVLLILDMISDFRFPDGLEVARAARRIAPHIRQLRERVTEARLATVYVNDNLGRWRSDVRGLVERCKGSGSRGREVVEMLAPRPRDYFVFKPRHSAFYATPVEVLLRHLRAQRLIITGVSSHQCVLFTANDAHVREFELVVPSDCIGSPERGETRFALEYFESVLGAKVAPAARLRLMK
jgi:isochorismate hydrolase